MWVRAPPNPNILFDFESRRSRYRSHSTGDGGQSNQQFHTVGCCYLLLFLRVILADLTFMTRDLGTSKCFKYLFGRFQKYRQPPFEVENRHTQALSSFSQSLIKNRKCCQFFDRVSRRSIRSRGTRTDNRHRPHGRFPWDSAG